MKIQIWKWEFEVSMRKRQSSGFPSPVMFSDCFCECKNCGRKMVFLFQGRETPENLQIIADSYCCDKCKSFSRKKILEIGRLEIR